MSTGKAPEKSNFSRRCSLLSRYLKEKGSFGDIGMQLARKPDLELAGKSDLGGQENAIQKTKALESIPKFYVGEASTSCGGKTKDGDVSVIPDPGNSQLTIFFDGNIIVYNEFPQHKAKELIKVAKEANHVVVVDPNNTSQNHMNLDLNIISSERDSVIPDLNKPTSNENHQTGQQQQVVERIARRASLHRFFAKRKDRAVARAPYQVNQNGDHLLPPKPKSVVPSAEAGQSSRPLNTNRGNDMPMEVDEEEKKCSEDLELKL